MPSSNADIVAHAFWNRICYDIPTTLASPDLWLPQWIPVQFFYDPFELTFWKSWVQKIMEHLSFVRGYVLLMPYIGPVTLYQKQVQVLRIQGGIFIHFKNRGCVTHLKMSQDLQIGTEKLKPKSSCHAVILSFFFLVFFSTPKLSRAQLKFLMNLIKVSVSLQVVPALAAE